MSISRVRFGATRLALLAIAAFAACDATEAPTGPEAAPTVVFGRIASSPGTSPGAASIASAGSLAGIIVSTEDGSSSSTTDNQGAFRLEVRSEDGRVRLRFRRGSLDLRLELSGLPEGGIFQLDLSISDDDVTVLSTSDSNEADFDGIVAELSVSGDAPERVAVLEVRDDDETFTVSVREGETVFDQGKDILDFASLLEGASDPLIELEVDGEGELQADGTIVAAEIEVEVEEVDSEDDSHDDSDDDDGENDPEDFSGAAGLVEVSGDAPMRTARIEVTNLAGTTMIDVIEGSTSFDPLGDAVSFDAMLVALMTDGLAVEIEGDGTLQADGSVVATSVKVETDG